MKRPLLTLVSWNEKGRQEEKARETEESREAGSVPLCAFVCVRDDSAEWNSETENENQEQWRDGKAIREERIQGRKGEGERWRQQESRQERRRANTGESKGQIKKCSAETESEATVDP